MILNALIQMHLMYTHLIIIPIYYLICLNFRFYQYSSVHIINLAVIDFPELLIC
jgi:hypothetical protein